MNEPIEIINNHQPFRALILHDEYAEDPRLFQEPAWTFAFASEGYQWGDSPIRDDRDAIQTLIDNKDTIAYPVYWYIHGIISLVLSELQYEKGDEWSSGIVGYACITKQKRQSEWGTNEKTRELSMKYLKGELEEYEAYLNGSTYQYVIEQKCSGCNNYRRIPTDDVTINIINGPYYGDLDGVREDAEAELKLHTE